PAALGQGFRVLVHIEMANQARSTIEAFEAEVQGTAAVPECRRMFGQPDDLLCVGVQDLAAYETLHTTRPPGLPGVARPHSPVPTIWSATDGSGTPYTATSATSGCRAMIRSIGAVPRFSPSTRSQSPVRPTK